MEELRIEPTKSTPFIQIDTAKNRIVIKGESYPENPAKFFEPIWSKVESYLSSDIGSPVQVDIELSYFNSSSSKALMNFFGMLENANSAGQEISVNWWYNRENESAMEAGEEFKEDVPSLTFLLKPLD
ncbi:MAG: DUF1987 domain-containing protein [Syntrophaceae bacterium]|nr:DUF1987 domain-containing protein [Syntrophaceae bacterium]